MSHYLVTLLTIFAAFEIGVAVGIVLSMLMEPKSGIRRR
jgi:ABC-type nitrate/sulfonate/bicarbonate transport system permease component